MCSVWEPLFIRKGDIKIESHFTDKISQLKDLSIDLIPHCAHKGLHYELSSTLALAH